MDFVSRLESLAKNETTNENDLFNFLTEILSSQQFFYLTLVFLDLFVEEALNCRLEKKRLFVS